MQNVSTVSLEAYGAGVPAAVIRASAGNSANHNQCRSMLLASDPRLICLAGSAKTATAINGVVASVQDSKAVAMLDLWQQVRRLCYREVDMHSLHVFSLRRVIHMHILARSVPKRLP